MSKIDSTVTVLNRQDFDTTFSAGFNTVTPAAGSSIITPSTGKQLQITGVMVKTAATAGSIHLRFASSDDTVAKDNFGTIETQYFTSPIYKLGAINEPLEMVLAGTGTTQVMVFVNYKEV